MPCLYKHRGKTTKALKRRGVARHSFELKFLFIMATADMGTNTDTHGINETFSTSLK